MRKKVKQYMRKTLCGILSAAMILTSLSVPELATYAAQPDVMDEVEVPEEEVREQISTEEVSSVQETEDEESTVVETESETETDSNQDEKTKNEIDLMLEKHEKEVNNREEEPTGSKNYIENGDFNLDNGNDWVDGKFGKWAFSDADYWKSVDLKSDCWAANIESPSDSEDNNDYGLNISYKADYIFSLYQSLDLPAGKYEMTAYVKAPSTYETKAYLFQGESNGTETIISDGWTKVTYAFELSANKTDYQVGLVITSKNGAWIYVDDVTLYCTELIEVTYKLDDLSDLYNEVEKLIDGKTSDDYKEGWKELNEALDEAKKLIDESSSDSDAIAKAYTDLEDAKNNLKVADVKVTLYYYVGDIKENAEVGLYYWGDNISTTATKADWQGWKSPNNTDTYLMTAEENYAGWYSIPLTFQESGAKSGFSIHTSMDEGASALYQCGGTNNHESDYEKLVSGDEKTYAVKQFEDTDKYILYKGDDEITGVMRNITFYVYSADSVPAIMSESELSYIDESTGAIEKLEPDYTNSNEDEGWANYYYNMNQDNNNDNWYYLTFSAPEKEKAEDKICQLYYVLESNEPSYDWKMNFLNGSASDEYSVDFTPVFEGNVYYKDGVLYKSVESADGITLSMLKDLLASDKYTEIINKGESGYTADSWHDFENAKTQAETVVKDFSGQDDEITDEKITVAYEALSAAIKNIVSNGTVVTLYYYSEDLKDYEDTDTEKYNLYLSTWNNTKISSTNEELKLSQGSWDYTAYAFEKVTDESINLGYDNWYSIPIRVLAANDGADGDGFIIQTGKAVTTDGATSHEALESDKGIITISHWVNADIYSTIASSESGKSIVVKDGAMYESIEAASTVTLEDLQELVAQAEALDQENYEADQNWDHFQNALASAKEVIASENPTDDAIKTAYNDLKATMGALVLSGTVITLYYYSEDLNEFEDTDTEKYNLYLSTWDNTKISSTNKELKLSQGTWDYTAYAFEKVTDQSINLGYDNWYSVPIKVLAANDGADGDGFIIQTGKAVTTDGTTSHVALQSDIGLIKISYWENTDIYSAIASSESGKSIVIKDGQMYDSIEAASTVTLEDLQALVVQAETLEQADYEAGQKWDDFQSALALAKEVIASPDPTDDAIKTAYNNLKSAMGALVLNGRVITLYYYSEDLNEYTDTDTEKYNLYLSTWNNAKITSTNEELKLSQGTWDYTAYAFEKVTDENINFGHDNWYSIPVKVLAANDGADGDGFLIQTGKATTTDGITSHAALESDTGLITISYWENTSIYSAIASLESGRSIAIMDGKMYASIQAVYTTTLDDLQKLIEEAEKLEKADYKEDENWKKFEQALASAKEVLTLENPAEDVIKTAYNNLQEAMDALVYKTEAGISVKKVAVPENFITGADLSSYVSLKESGTIFKDENGKALSDEEFFEMLREGGTNWVRIRIWNDPYNSNGNGYGGGNSDLDKAKIIGKLATKAGMRVLIDFHYSDFWADPSKQDAPKAWENYTIEQKETAVHDYTLESLQALRAAGVDVGMVQVGNETNNAICGENSWTNMARIFNAGSKAVREFDKDCIVALHFADPSSSAFLGYASNAKKYGVDYDVFAASFYPFWHGTTENLTEKLTKIATEEEYGCKKVMVAETSWVTTWEDGDGHENTSPKLPPAQTLDYPVSVQGQADEMRDVINAVNSVNNAVSGNPAIGVFYWEPAWVSPNYVYNGKTVDQGLYNKNKSLWEKYGSGWASSYSAEYDPTDAGRWYGGSAVDNQAWFDFSGQALETVKMYNYIRTGASAAARDNEIANVENKIKMNVNVGDTIQWPDGSKVVVTFSDGTKTSDKGGNSHIKSVEVEWDEDQVPLVNTDKAAVYNIDGVAKCTYYIVDGKPETKTELHDVVLELEVLSTSSILVNGGFENGDANPEPWVVIPMDEQTAADIKDSAIAHAEVKKDDPHNGSWGMHFWAQNAIHFKVEQTVANLKAGSYTLGGFIQGNGASSKDEQILYVTVTGTDGSKTTYEAVCSLNGWLNWVNPEITNIKVSDGDSLTVGMEIQSTVGGAWGTIDDLYLYGKYGINVDSTEHGTINISSMEANSGEIVRIAAVPEAEYYLSELTISGEGVNENTLRDESGAGVKPVCNAEQKTATLKYSVDDNNKGNGTMPISFVMPEGVATLKAVFAPIDFSSGPVSMEKVKATGFVQDSNGKYVYEIAQAYTGKEITLNLELYYAGYKLTPADYEASYEKNKDVGEAAITVTAKSNKFTGTKTLYFNIVKKVDISKAKAVLEQQIYYYTGDEVEPKLASLTDKTGAPLKTEDGADLKLDPEKDYALYFEKNIKVGTATMYVIAKRDSMMIQGAFKQTFKIEKRPITEGITISTPAGGTYTGQKVTPNVTVKFNNKVLQKGRDYTITYKNNVNVSTVSSDKKPSLKITGKGNYTGSTEEYNFEISPKNINDYGIIVKAEAVAEGKPYKITVKNGTKTLSLNKNYNVTKIVYKAANGDEEKYPNGSSAKSDSVKLTEAGTYIATIEGVPTNGYTGSREVEFRVVDKDHLISNAKIKVSGTKVYTGGEVTLSASELTVESKKYGPLKAGENYTVSYSDENGNKTNIKSGKATLTITGQGEYAGTKKVSFTIKKRPLSISDATDKGLITWETKEDTILFKAEKSMKDSSGLISLPYTGNAWKPELNIYVVNEGSSKKLLTQGVDYTISYKKNQKPGDVASVKITGKGNYSGSVTVDNVFTVKDVTLNDFVITVNPVEYTGSAVKPKINFVYKELGVAVDMKQGTAYATKYKNNIKIASIESTDAPTVTITEKGLNASKKGADKTTLPDLKFTITTGRITAASIKEIKVQSYKGKPVEPKLTIQVNGKSLKVGKDYIVTYTGNTSPNDKAIAHVIGIGNYSGTVNKEFVIY